MKGSFNDMFVQAIRTHIPEGEPIAAWLMNLLNLGKESVYRRLRSEIPFTFEEVIKVSAKLSLSIDNIIGFKKAEQALYYLDKKDKVDVAKDFIEEGIKALDKIFKDMYESKRGKARMALNHLPYYYSFSQYFENLAKFRLYRWSHQAQIIDSNKSFSDYWIPYDTSELLRKIVNENQRIPQTEIIMDYNIFRSITKEIEYFHQRGLISESDLRLIQADLLQFVNNIEILARKGHYETGAELAIYISHIDLKSSYSHFGYNETAVCQLQAYSAKSLLSEDPDACRLHKDWFESLKRYSTLITQSGEMQRFEYFNKQRELVNRLSDRLQ